jgi:hypothetical protein
MAWITPGIHKQRVKKMLKIKAPMRPVVSTAMGGNIKQKKYRIKQQITKANVQNCLITPDCALILFDPVPGETDFIPLAPDNIHLKPYK